MSADLVRARIDEGPVVPLMWLVVFLGFLLNLADGIDVVAMSVTAPSVAAAWGLERAALGPLFQCSAVWYGHWCGGSGATVRSAWPAAVISCGDVPCGPEYARR